MSRYLGLSIKYGYVSYCLIIDDSIKKFGSISMKCLSLNHTTRINNLFTLLKSTDGSDNNHWYIGLQDDLINPRSQEHVKKLYNLCRLRSIIECYSNIIFGSKPIFIKEFELYKSLGKILNFKVTNTLELVNYTRSKLKVLNSLNELQFNNISIAWAIALFLKRYEMIESYKLDQDLMSKIENHVRNDEVLLDLLKNRAGNEGIEDVIKHRVNRLVDLYIEKLVD